MTAFLQSPPTEHAPATPAPPVDDLLDPGSVSVLAYLVGQLAAAPVTDDTGTVAELLALADILRPTRP